MSEKHQINTDRSKLYFADKRESVFTRSDIKRIGLGILLTAGVIGGALYHHSQESNDNPAFTTRPATLTFEPGGSTWSASELIASADGIDPTQKINYPEVDNIAQTLAAEENSNGVVTPQTVVKDVYVEVDKNHLHVSQMSGYGAQLKFTDKK